MQKTTSAPSLSIALYVQYESSILWARKLLFEYLQARFPVQVAERALQLLEDRANSSNSPLMGELCPWFFKRVFPVLDKNEGFKKLLLQWLSLYLLVVIFDDATDKKTQINPGLAMVLIVGAGDFITEPEAFTSLRAQLSDIRNEPDYNKNAYVGTLARKMNKLSYAPNDSLAEYFGGSEMMKFLQITDDLGDAEEDLSRKRVTSIIKPYMVQGWQQYPTISDVLCSENPSNPLSDISESLHKLSMSSSVICSGLMTREKELASELKTEIEFFSNIKEEAGLLATFIASKRFSIHGENDSAFAIEVQDRFKILASST
ncbi:MAG: hypothetical protein AAB681_02275 [Patescibacteria group bacterium]